MSSKVVMRPLKDGSGYSPCSASEENVGKRRCNHTRSSVTFNVTVEKVGSRIEEITVSDTYEKMDKRDKTEVVSCFVNNLPEIDQETASSVIAKLREM